jgi:hypothetical protein
LLGSSIIRAEHVDPKRAAGISVSLNTTPPSLSWGVATERRASKLVRPSSALTSDARIERKNPLDKVSRGLLLAS